ncbi:MAG TPA: hypothetical protein DCY40_06885 [Actinobacteria bacterium]|nr:hypothetical protein [Actinomycetota bacterium]
MKPVPLVIVWVGLIAAACSSPGSTDTLAAGLLLATVTAAPALASGTVDCLGGGILYTFGRSTVSQIHKVVNIGQTPNLGPGNVQVNWGWHSSSYQWDVFGTGVYYESARCVI